MGSSERLIGTAQLRVDGWEKISGSCRFVDDHRVSGAWYGGTVRSPVARGRLRAVARDPAFDWSRVVFVTAADLPGPNTVAMIREDHPILARDEVRFFAEAVALIAAPDRELLDRALAAVRVEVDELPPVLSVEEALAPTAVIWGEDNVLAQYTIERGDLEAGFAAADVVVEGTYRTGYQEHLYLEPNGVIAVPRDDGGVEILGSLQCPYYVHAALVRAFGLAESSVVVRQAPTGGAFGGKEDYPSVIALHAALLARAAGRPVRLLYERGEDIRGTTKRHPSRTYHRTGVRRDGTIVAAAVDLVLDGGAYTTLSPVVLSRALLHAGGAYRLPAARLRGRAVATNTPPNGAFRGFGAPQSLFAIERQIDRIAAVLGLDPLEIRRRNLLRDGDTLPCGQRLPRDVAAGIVLERAVALSGYEEKRRSAAPRRREIGTANEAAPWRDDSAAKEFASWRDSDAATATEPWRGIGLAVGLHGGGFTGAGEERISGRARVCFTAGAGLEIQVSNVEMGQGASTVLAMLAAEALGLPLSLVRHAQPDTARVPDTGPTVASRTTMIVGQIVIDACADLAERLRERLARSRGRLVDAVAIRPEGVFVDGHRSGDFATVAAEAATTAPLIGEAVYRPPPGLHWDEESYRGDAYKSYSWVANVVEVTIDPDTLAVRPERVVTVVEIGRAIHPVLAVGQVEGGVVQALGWGYLEEVKTNRGRYLNDRFTTYIVPTSLDVPELETEIIELPDEYGARGAKGLGELPMDVGAAALAAAVDHAADCFASEIPITPERLFTLIRTSAAAVQAEPSGGAP